MDYRRPVWVEIDLQAISHNVETFKRIIGPDTLFMAVVKTDGYGHGAVPVAKRAIESGADRIGVALVEEGIELRKAGIDVPIHLLSLNPASAAGLIVEHDLITTVATIDFARHLDQEAGKAGKRVKVHVKVDTGMNRIGISPDNTISFLEELKTLTNLEIEGVFTHFALADDPFSSFTELQIERFEKVLNDLEEKGLNIPLKHEANSAATILFPQTRLDMVRVGISLYGLHPSEATLDKIDIRPAFKLKAKVSFVKEVPTGDGVSYSHTFKPKKNTTIATLPLGYGDGYSRLFSNSSEVLVGGRRRPVVGNICMDQLMIDLGEEDTVSVGDEAVLIGDQDQDEISVDELAGILKTINYEVVCMINRRVPRVYED